MRKICFNGVQQLEVEIAANLRENFEPPLAVTDIEAQPMLSIIFAPDPITGNPCSDLFCQISDPSVKEYIDRELQAFYTESEKTNDPVLALECSKSRFELAQDYIDRVRAYIQKVNSHE